MSYIKSIDEKEYYFICNCNCNGCKNETQKTMAEFLFNDKKEAIHIINWYGFVIHREYKISIKNIIIHNISIPFIQN